MSVTVCFRFFLGLAFMLALLPTAVFAGFVTPPNDVVPEPSSIIVWLGILGVGALSYRRTKGNQDN